MRALTTELKSDRARFDAGETIAQRGHRPGGDPVQQHSAGDLYPFVIAVLEENGDPRTRRYEVLGPKLDSGYWWNSPEDAENAARQLKQAWERRPRPVRTLGDYLANKYDVHDGSGL